jgi:hypothetical protein
VSNAALILLAHNAARGENDDYYLGGYAGI